MIPLIANHLWQSTLFVAGVASLAHFARRNSARVRYALWLAASLKFLVPFAFLAALGAHLDWHHDVAESPQFVLLVDKVAEPLAAPGPTTQTVTSSTALVSQATVSSVLVMIWACGALAVVTSWLKRWRRLRQAVRVSKSVEIHSPVPVRSSAMLLEPGVVGLFRPVLLLPEGIEGRLSAAQLQAVLAHELCHVRRRDNLTASLHMTVELLLWFYPLVWWLGARLIAERELACDEDVLAGGTDPETYAEGILRVCQHYVESPLFCAAGVSGANLKGRIETIMKNRVTVHLTLTRKILLAGLAAAAVALPVAVGLLTSSRATAQIANTAAGSGAFDAVKISKASGQGLELGVTNDGSDETLHVRDVSLRAVVALAYDVERARVVGGPDWLDGPLYDITAHANTGPEPTAAPDNGRIGPGLAQRNRVKTMLADRFGLQAHMEVRELPALALRVVKTGSKLSAAGGPAGGHPSRPQFLVHDHDVSGSNMDMSFLAHCLSDLVGRPVLDQTGLSGRYDFSLAGPHTSEALPGMLREQVGLQLDGVTAPVNVVVVDSVRRPIVEAQSGHKSPPTSDQGLAAHLAALVQTRYPDLFAGKGPGTPIVSVLFRPDGSIERTSYRMFDGGVTDFKPSTEYYAQQLDIPASEVAYDGLQGIVSPTTGQTILVAFTERGASGAPSASVVGADDTREIDRSLTERYFPDVLTGSVDAGLRLWILFDSEGHVLRTGRELRGDEPIDHVLQARFPGIETQYVTNTAVTDRSARLVRDRAGEPLGLLCVWLKKGSPTPSLPNASSTPNGAESPDRTFAIDADDADIRDVVAMIARKGSHDILMGDQVNGRVSIHLKDVTWSEALNIVVLSNGLAERQSGNITLVDVPH